MIIVHGAYQLDDDHGPGASFRWALHTSDAHGRYRQFGFLPPDGYLERPACTTVAPQPQPDLAT